MSSSSDLSYYCHKLERLNVNKHKKRGIAPHKPILLLSVIELISQKKIEANRIYLNVELISTFQKYWSSVGSHLHRSSINLPFYHLTGDGFWHLKFKYDSIKDIGTPSLKVLNENVSYAYLDEELFQFIILPESRMQLLRVLINKWFSDKQDEINSLFQIDAFQDFQNRLKEMGGKIYSPDELKTEEEETAIVRDATFRKVVTSVYNHSCAFCGLRIIDSRSQNIVDGAHIMPFSVFRDNRISNGLSLCKNHHWAFDRGWFGINQSYEIQISNSIEESVIDQKTMKEFSGQRIFLPTQDFYRPSKEALAWHLENIFYNEIFYSLF